jgi:hypothetical protein
MKSAAKCSEVLRGLEIHASVQGWQMAWIPSAAQRAGLQTLFRNVQSCAVQCHRSGFSVYPLSATFLDEVEYTSMTLTVNGRPNVVVERVDCDHWLVR